MKVLLTSAMALGVIVTFGASEPAQAAPISGPGYATYAPQGGQIIQVRHGYWGGRGYYYGDPYYGDSYYYSPAPSYYSPRILCIGPLCI